MENAVKKPSQKIILKDMLIPYNTEALFHSQKRQADWTARQILADLAGMTVNSTTNNLATKIIFGEDKHPQSQFNY